MQGGSDQNKIVLELALKMQELQKGQRAFRKVLKDFTKEISGLNKTMQDMAKLQAQAFAEIAKAAQRSSKEVVSSERSKAESLGKTNKELDKQKKHMQEAGKFMQSRTGKLISGFAAGAGLGGLGKPLTARGIGSGFGRLLSGGIGGIANFFMSGMQNAYQAYIEQGMAMGQLVGLGTRKQLMAGRRQAGRSGGANLGYSMAETAQQAAGVGRATGQIGAVYRAQQFSRATGMDVGEIAGYMGMMRQAGYQFNPAERSSKFVRTHFPGMPAGMQGKKGDARWTRGGPLGVNVSAPEGYTQYGRVTKQEGTGARELQKVMAAGMISGLEKARLPEFLKGINSMTSIMMSKTTGQVDVKSLAAFQAMLGKSGAPGLQGARGAEVATQLLQATKAPGGGEAGQAMMLQALGFGKPGGGTSYYEALKKQQTGGPENIAAMFKEVYSQLGMVGGGGTGQQQQEANLALSEMTGLGLKQIEDLGEILNSNMSAEEQMKAIKAKMEDSEPIEKQALKTMQEGFGGVIKRVAGLKDQMAALGAGFAPVMEAMQKLQIEALKVLAKYLPELVLWLKELYVNTTGWIYKQLEKFGKPGEELAKVTKPLWENIYKAGLGKPASFQERAMKLREQADIAQKGMVPIGMAGIRESNILSQLTGTDEDMWRVAKEGIRHAKRLKEGFTKEATKVEEVQQQLQSRGITTQEEELQQNFPRLYGMIQSRIGHGGIQATEKEYREELTKASEASIHKVVKVKIVNPEDVKQPATKSKNINMHGKRPKHP